MYPSKKDLKKGSILPIYSDHINEKDLIGNARLIEYKKSWRQELPFIKAEFGGTDKQAPHTIIWSYQRWVVEFVDGPRKGLRSAHYISYFVTVDSYFKSEL
jgi:hypothetical protein